MNEIFFRYLYDLTVGSAWLKPLVVFASVYLGWLLLGVVIIVFSSRRWRDELAFVISAAVSAWLVGFLIKWLWPVARPFVKLSEVLPLISVSDAGAFPSGHATFFFALALAVYALDQKLGQWLIAGAVIIGLARIMAGVHWPGDILGGFVLAGLVVLISWTLIKTRFPAVGWRERV